MDDVRDDREPDAPWDQVATGFAELGDLLRSGFAGSDSRGGSREELRQAWAGFVSSAQDLGQALANTITDPEFRAGAKDVFGSLIDTIGVTVRDAAAGARGRQARGTDEAPSE